MIATKIMKIGTNYKVGGSDTKFQQNKFSIRPSSFDFKEAHDM